MGQYQKAESIYKKIISVSQLKKGENSRSYIIDLNNLAYLYKDIRQFDQAEQLYRESLAKRRELFSSDAMRVASSAGNLARLLAKTHQFDEADKLLKELMPVYILNKRTNLYNHATDIAVTIGDGSAQSCQQGIEKINNTLPELNKVSENSWRRMQAELWLGQLASQCNEKDLAKQILNAALEKSKKIYKAESQGQKIIAQEVELASASNNS